MLQKSIVFLIALLALQVNVWGQTAPKERASDKFAQLYEELPTPNSYRNAAGAPGHEYWQQKADYIIELEVDDDKQIIRGKRNHHLHQQFA